MNKESIESSVIGVVAEVLDIDQTEIDVNKSLEELGFDSIKFMNLLLQMDDLIEKGIDEILENIEVSQIKTVNDIINLVKTQA